MSVFRPDSSAGLAMRPLSPSIADSGVAAAAPQLIVTTLDDIVDADDGVLSLREAVSEANAREGLDIISFADGIEGGKLILTGSENSAALEIRDAIIVDGGAGTTIQTSGDPRPAFSFVNTSGVLEGIDIRSGTAYAVIGITSEHSDVSLINVNIEGADETATGIFARGGSLEIAQSRIESAGYSGFGVETVDGTELVIIDSEIVASGYGGVAIDGEGSLAISGSTLEAIGLYTSRGILFSGTVNVENTTIKAVSSDLNAGSPSASDRPVELEAGSEALLDHVTIIGPTQPVQAVSDGTEFVGIEVEDGATLVLQDSIVVGDMDTVPVRGDFIDAGGNVLGDGTTITIADVFETGELVDNGGSTRTIALLDDPANPAIGAAIPTNGTDTDQRGFARDADPDAGAFEAGASAPPAGGLPPLSEGIRVDENVINGLDPRALVIGEGQDATITFVDEFGAFKSVLGVYLIGANGEISDPRIVFDFIEQAEPSDLASQAARPGGGPLASGDEVPLGLIYEDVGLEPGTGFGLFLIADGASRNDAELFAGGRLEFRDGDGPATLASNVPQLVHVGVDGSETVISGNILHLGGNDPAGNPLNPGGGIQTISARLADGGTIIGIEDKPVDATDADYNDVLIAIGFPPGDGLITPAESPIV